MRITVVPMTALTPITNGVAAKARWAAPRQQNDSGHAAGRSRHVNQHVPSACWWVLIQFRTSAGDTPAHADVGLPVGR